MKRAAILKLVLLSALALPGAPRWAFAAGCG